LTFDREHFAILLRKFLSNLFSDLLRNLLPLRNLLRAM
jgi:hypothetical protein